MSRMANLSIMALYGWDNTLFDLLTLPTGLSKADLVNNICSQLAELELLYPNPDVMKSLIGLWSNACQYEWNKLYETMLLEYNPIDNYDRTETRTLASQGSGNSADGGSDTFAGNGTGKVAGFNSQSTVTRDENTNSSTSTYGKTNTYGTIAKRLGSSARAIGSAVGHNPISVIIPCHRVLGADGNLTGYAGGLENKEKLLRLEGVIS